MPNVVLMATGTGVVPMLSLLRDLSHNSRPLTLGDSGVGVQAKDPDSQSAKMKHHYKKRQSTIIRTNLSYPNSVGVPLKTLSRIASDVHPSKQLKQRLNQTLRSVNLTSL
jgi:hypothetical protein